MTNAVLAVAAAQARGGLPPDPILVTGDTAISPSMAGAAIDHAIGNRTSTRDRRRLTYPRSRRASTPRLSRLSHRVAARNLVHSHTRRAAQSGQFTDQQRAHLEVGPVCTPRSAQQWPF